MILIALNTKIKLTWCSKLRYIHINSVDVFCARCFHELIWRWNLQTSYVVIFFCYMVHVHIDSMFDDLLFHLDFIQQLTASATDPLPKETTGETNSKPTKVPTSNSQQYSG